MSIGSRAYEITRIRTGALHSPRATVGCRRQAGGCDQALGSSWTTSAILEPFWSLISSRPKARIPLKGPVTHGDHIVFVNVTLVDGFMYALLSSSRTAHSQILYDM